MTENQATGAWQNRIVDGNLSSHQIFESMQQNDTFKHLKSLHQWIIYDWL